MRNVSAGLLIIAGLVFACVGPAAGAGPVSITQDKALAGGVSSGDGPAYPILITDPGSYRLDGDLYPSNAPYGISISSPNVTLDLNGFRIFGVGSVTDGIAVNAIGVTIKNGTITNFRRHGIVGVLANQMTIDRMKITGIGGLQGSAILCGAFCMVRDSIITGNNAGVDNYYWTFKNWGSGNMPLLIQGTTVASNGAFQIRTPSALILGNILVGENPIENHDPEGVPPYFVGYGNNTILSDDPPVGATPLQPNFCNPAC
jgi:hypothetical protein